MNQDPTAAARILLLSDDDIRELLDKTSDGVPMVFCQQLPEEAASAESHSSVLIQDELGIPEIGGYTELQEQSFNVICFGPTHEAAKMIYLRVRLALKQARRQVIEDMLLHSFEQIGSPRAMVDQATNWTYIHSTWKCLASDVSAP